MNKLSLEQCKSLKKWGYPQDSQKDTFYYSDRENAGISPVFNDGESDYRGYVACPTLEELIEWLRNEFWTLKNEGGKTWYVQGDTGETENNIILTEGDTPLLAVYALAEALHSNN